MTLMDFKIADAVPAHLARIEEIERECFSLPWTREQLESQLTGEGHVFLVALYDGEAAGYVGMTYVLDEGYISNVAVAPEYRRHGAGNALIAALKSRAEKLGLAFLTLEVRRSNAPAAALYEKHGFVVVGTRKNYYERPREDALLMTYYIEKKAQS